MSHSLYYPSVTSSPSMPCPPAPNYVVRRLAVGALVLLAVTAVVAITALGLPAGPGGRPASASRAEPAHISSAAIYVAVPGDSLWSIARAYHGEVGLDRYVDTLIDLNGGTSVQIGQAVRLP